MDLSTLTPFFKRISIRGRVAYCIMCLENAFEKEKIESQESFSLLEKLWAFTNSHTLDEWDEMINDVTPCCILDENFDVNDFVEDANIVYRFKDFYEKLPEYLNDIIDLTIGVGVGSLYGGVGSYSKRTLEPTLNVVELIVANDVIMPHIGLVANYSFDDFHGWGYAFTREDVIKGELG